MIKIYTIFNECCQVFINFIYFSLKLQCFNSLQIILDLAFRNMWQTAELLAENPIFAHKMYLKPEMRLREGPDGSTQRIFGPYNTGLFFHAMQDHFGDDVTLMFNHLFSDETKTVWKGSKYPIYGAPKFKIWQLEFLSFYVITC